MKKSTDARRPGRQLRRAGFTLLEVLAAVAILGIWFSVLASVAIQGQRAEGENERRMRASLLADAILTEIELDFEAAVFPDEQGEEIEKDEFLVTIESFPFTELDFSGGDEGFVEALDNELAGIAEDLRAVQIDVTWTEGSTEKQVTRLAYAWDPTRLQELLGQLPSDDELPEDELPEDELPQDGLPEDEGPEDGELE